MQVTTNPRVAAPRGSRARAAVRFLWAAAIVVLLAIVARGFLGDVFYVKSSSMEPTLLGGDEGGESVLVRFTRDPTLRRFDLVVVQRPGQPEPVVKRVAALPGETVFLSDGDLVVDGRRLDWRDPRPAFVPVYDSERRPAPDVFYFKREPDGPWRGGEGTWTVDARSVERGSNGGMMSYGPDLRDAYWGPDGAWRDGIHQVGDAVLEVQFSAAGGDGRVRFDLVEEGDTFEAVVEWGPDGGTRLAFERWMQDEAPAVLEERELHLEPDTWHAVRFWNVDNNLVFEIVGRGVLLAAPYAANQRYLGAVHGNDKSVGSRVAFGAEGLEVRFRGIRILRDLHYTDQGEFAVEAPLTLGLDELFLLGDNSADSRDSRFWGPVAASRIVGRPVAVVWPWGRRRGLAGPSAPPPLAVP